MKFIALDLYKCFIYLFEHVFFFVFFREFFKNSFVTLFLDFLIQKTIIPTSFYFLRLKIILGIVTLVIRLFRNLNIFKLKL